MTPDSSSPQNRPSPDPSRHALVFAQLRRARIVLLLKAAALLGVVLLSLWLTGIFQPAVLYHGAQDLYKIVAKEGFPPDFSAWPSWVLVQLTERDQEKGGVFVVLGKGGHTWLFYAFHLDEDYGIWKYSARGALELGPVPQTLIMAISGTVLAVLMAFPLSFLAARNTTPHAGLYFITRAFFNVMRTIPELVKGVLLVAAVGFGLLPGALAMAFHSVGMVGKFFSEALEHVDERPVEAVRACGASKFQALWHGVLPQVLPHFVDITMYRWEYNIRCSMVLGFVGAGGIGADLYLNLRYMDYKKVTAIIIIVFCMVFVVDLLSAWLRKRFK